LKYKGCAGDIPGSVEVKEVAYAASGGAGTAQVG